VKTITILTVATLLILVLPTTSSTHAPSGAYELGLMCVIRPNFPIGSMETDYRDNMLTCWFHNSIHQYFVGHDRTLNLYHGTGAVVSVEQQFSPGGNLSVDTTPAGVTVPIHVELSMDGFSWAPVAQIEYRFVNVVGVPTRQTINVDFDAQGAEFRYLRVRHTESLMQGLSGYLDHSFMRINVTDGSPVAAPTLAPATRSLSCTNDIMEDIFPTHPCWFGGLNRWDAPSWFHTYPLERAEVDSVRGNATFAYFRPDDPGQTTGVVAGTGFVYGSADSFDWTVVGSFPIVYGVESSFFFPNLGGVPVRFLRVASDKHPGWATDAALAHPEGYLLSSELVVTGDLP
jgi:hypothetical protein